MNTSMGSGLDFATFMNSALRNNGDDMWGGNNGLLWIFLLILLGGGGWNFGNRAGNLTNDAAITGALDAAIQKARADGLGEQAIMDAIRGNQTAIQTLATTFNTDIGNVQQALCALTFSTIVNVLPSCVSVNNQANLQVVATSANSGTMTSANL